MRVQADAETGLALLLVGELGRVADLSQRGAAAGHLAAAVERGSEDVKATAALALGAPCFAWSELLSCCSLWADRGVLACMCSRRHS